MPGPLKGFPTGWEGIYLCRFVLGGSTKESFAVRWIKGKNQLRSDQAARRARFPPWLKDPATTAWLQTVASLIALGLTLHLANSVVKDTEKRAMEMAMISAVQLVDVMDDALLDCTYSTEIATASQFAQFDYALEVSRSVPVRDLPVDVIGDWLLVTKNAIHFKERYRALQGPKTQTATSVCNGSLKLSREYAARGRDRLQAGAGFTESALKRIRLGSPPTSK